MENEVTRIASHLEHLTDHLCERLKGLNYQVVSSREPAETMHRSFAYAITPARVLWLFTSI